MLKPGPYHYQGFVARADMIDALILYAVHRVPLGDFLTAVVSNNLMGACGRADEGNMRNLPAFCAYLYNEMPSGSFMSKEAYEAWLSGGKSDQPQVDVS